MIQMHKRHDAKDDHKSHHRERLGPLKRCSDSCDRHDRAMARIDCRADRWHVVLVRPVSSSRDLVAVG
jgi:hypothetical protein